MFLRHKDFMWDKILYGIFFLPMIKQVQASVLSVKICGRLLQSWIKKIISIRRIDFKFWLKPIDECLKEKRAKARSY
jgi:hypothetical protein